MFPTGSICHYVSFGKQQQNGQLVSSTPPNGKWHVAQAHKRETTNEWVRLRRNCMSFSNDEVKKFGRNKYFIYISTGQLRFI